MAEDAKLKLEVRLAPAEGEPDAALFDDLVRLIRQGAATVSPQAPPVSAAGEFVAPQDKSQAELEAKVCNRIEQASAASRADVEKRAAVAQQPDGEAKLAEQAVEAAANVVAAVHRLLHHGVAVRVPDSQ
jgi:hypothetical protein